MERRQLLKACGVLLSTVVFERSLGLQWFSPSLFGAEARMPIFGVNGELLKVSAMDKHSAFLFFYPFKGTPAYLINTGQELTGEMVPLKKGGSYQWGGGVGPNKSIVAYTAVCSHNQSFPTQKKSVINPYPAEGVIKCCAHKRSFDITHGGVCNKKSEPLATVALEWDPETDQLFVTGLVGTDFFKKFFKRHKRKLRKSHGSSAVAAESVEKIQLMGLEDYAKKQIKC